MNTDLEEIIKGLGEYFNKLGIDFFIVGARARDIISDEVGLKLSPRKTADVDFGLFVDSWDTLEKMREEFKKDKNIRLSSEENKVRYYYNETPFDLVPFGGVEKNGTVSWPPFYDAIMTVIGFKEAILEAKIVTIGSTDVKVVTPEMLVALKIVSWDENSSRQKDAQDINYIISNYERIDPDIYDCLLDNYEDILEFFDHDSIQASIALMGVRIKNFTSDKHTGIIQGILEDSSKKEKLARNMISPLGFDDGAEETGREKLESLLYGVMYKNEK